MSCHTTSASGSASLVWLMDVYRYSDPIYFIVRNIAYSGSESPKLEDIHGNEKVEDEDATTKPSHHFHASYPKVLFFSAVSSGIQMVLRIDCLVICDKYHLLSYFSGIPLLDHST